MVELDERWDEAKILDDLFRQPGATALWISSRFRTSRNNVFTPLPPNLTLVYCSDEDTFDYGTPFATPDSPSGS